MKKLSLIILVFFTLLISCGEDKPDNIKNNVDIIKKEIIKQKTPGQLCLDKIRNLKGDPIKHQDIDRSLLFEAKGYPVFFTEIPEHIPSEDKIIKAHRARFERANPWNYLVSDTNRRFYKYRPDIGRMTFLRNGYLYHPDPLRARSITQFVTLDMLTNEKEFIIQKGPLTMGVERKNKRYFYKDGPFKGRPASINFLDRLQIPEGGINGIIEPPLHIDFSTAKDEYLFDSIEPIKITEHHVVANVFYDDEIIQTLFERDDLQVRMLCESKDISSIRERKEKSHKGILALKKAILSFTLENNQFDEPKHEVGQEDGKLRDAWINFFYKGRLKYQYKNERMVEENYIYDHLGKPIPPQVCVDFLVDSLNRAGGSWYSEVNARRHPVKTSGKFDAGSFRYEDEDGEEQHYALRQIKGFSKFAEDHPEYFDILNLEEKKKIGDKDFPEYLASLGLLEGDMVFIKGHVPWDGNIHHHSFFVYQLDPITGFPSIIAGNASHASMRSWRFETNRTPSRYIYRIIRPKEKLLELFQM